MGFMACHSRSTTDFGNCIPVGMDSLSGDRVSGGYGCRTCRCVFSGSDRQSVGSLGRSIYSADTSAKQMAGEGTPQKPQQIAHRHGRSSGKSGYRHK